jgi:hypothetical protein
MSDTPEKRFTIHRNDAGTEAYRDEYVEKLERQLALALALLRHAKCPTCDGSGCVVREEGGCDSDGENDSRRLVQERCQWCDETNSILGKETT